jgi:phenylacetic acid degradation operon negative regulatory protein
VHEYRKIHLRDPQLPASLLPRQWAGTDAHTLCRNLYAKVFGASEEFLSTRVQTLDGVLPAPAAEVFARFGGLPQA